MTTPDRQKKGGRAFTPARIAALVVIGLVVLGLGYIHVSSGDDAVSVPSGAKAGDLILHDCDYATEDGSYAADCGTLVVPENRHKAGSRLIALPVTRIRARSADPAEPIFRLQGGPGITNMTFPAASRFAEKHDVVLVGYRGVDGSSRLDCPEVTSAREQARGFLTEKAMRADAAAYGSARSASPTRASTSPDTRFPSASTTSTRPARRWGTSASTSSARARGRARR